jgi:acyl-CoA oxidase
MSVVAEPAVGGDAEELRSVLFGPDEDRLHRPWRELLSAPAFRRRFDSPAEERLRIAYGQLRVLNAGIPDPLALVADPVRLACMHEWVGFVDPTLMTMATIHYNLFLGSLVDLGGRTAEDLASYAAMSAVGTFLMTEVGHGNDAEAVETVAVYDRDTDGFSVHTPCAAAQKFMPNTSPVGGPKTGLVGARLLVDGVDRGVFLFLVPLTDGAGTLPGIRVRRLPPRLGSVMDHCVTSFDQVRVPRGALLGGPHGRITDDGTFAADVEDRRHRYLASIGRVVVGKLCMSAGAVGCSRVAVALAVRYGRVREISGLTASSKLPVFELRSHHGPLAEALATTYAMNMLYREAARRWACRHDGDVADAVRFVSAAKTWISWQARTVCLESRERCGAQGLLTHNGIADQVAAAEGVITAEGDNQATMVKVATELLLGRRSPGPVPAPHGRDLTDPGFAHELLAAAEVIWLDRARAAMRRSEPGALARRNSAMGPALRAAELFAHREAARATARGAAEIASASGRESMNSVHLLFALRAVRAHSGDLLRHGFLTERHIDDLPLLVERLVSRVARDAPTLVDAFAVPEEFVADFPIAAPDYVLAYDDPGASWHGDSSVTRP